MVGISVHVFVAVMVCGMGSLVDTDQSFDFVIYNASRLRYDNYDHVPVQSAWPEL